MNFSGTALPLSTARFDEAVRAADVEASVLMGCYRDRNVRMRVFARQAP